MSLMAKAISELTSGAREKRIANTKAGVPPQPQGAPKAPSARSKLVIKDRQTKLLKVGFEAIGLNPADKDLLPPDERKLTGVNVQDRLIDLKTGAEGNIGFGRCAETYFYIWAGTWM